MKYLRRALVATVALAATAVGGCADDGGGPEPSPTSTSSSEAPSATPVPPPSESEIASDTASAALRTYFTTVDLVRKDSSVSPDELEAVATSAQLAAQQNLLTAQRNDGLRQVGDTRVVELQVQSVSLDAPATALIDVCWDVSDVDVVDAIGKSAVSPDRKDVGWTRYTVTNDQWETAPEDGWRVSGGADLEKDPCAAS